MELFGNREGVGQSMLVIDPARADAYKQKVGSHLSFIGVKLIVGGQTLAEQMKAAREKLTAEVTHVIVHDAARPAVPYTDLDALFALDPLQPAAAMGVRVAGMLAEAGALPGLGNRVERSVLQVMTPLRFTRSTYDAVCEAGALPSEFYLISASPLNVRCGDHDPKYIKTMIDLLPKPKAKPPSSPFEEAQW